MRRLAVLLFFAAASGAEEAPLLTLRADTVASLDALADLPPLAAARLLDPEAAPAAARRGFLAFAPLAPFEPVRFLAMLRARGATDLRCELLPPVVPPCPGRFSALLPESSAKEGLAVLLRQAGLDPAAPGAKVDRKSGVLALPGKNGPLFAALRKGRLLLAGSRSALERSLPDDLPPAGLSVSVDGVWALEIASAAAGAGVPFADQLAGAGLSGPAALHLRVAASEGSGRLEAAASWPGAGPAPSVATPAPDGADAQFEAHLDLAPLLAAAGRWTGAAPDAWAALLAIGDAIDPSGTESLRAGGEGLRMLTGVSAPDLAACLGPRGAFRMPAQGGWCAKIEVRDGPRLAALLRRCAAWAGALLPEESRFALVEETGGLYAARIEGESPFVLRLESDHLLLAADPSSARCAPALVNALPGRCLAWRILPGPGVREALSVSRTGMLLAFLREESGAVVLGDGQLRLEAEGKCAPLGLALLAGLELSGDPGAGGEAKATLRRFLEAQHSYRALGFAALNGRPAGFAPGFAELVEDRGEGGPLGPWFDSFLPISEDCTFSEVASLAASGGWFRGYRWYFAAAIGARAVDPAREFAILAVPRDPEVDPALLMREDGRIWRRQAETLTLRRPIAVPSDPAKEGWTLD